MKMFLIKFESGEYRTNCHITSNYLYYERTIHKAAADRLNDVDSQLVVVAGRNQQMKANLEQLAKHLQ